MPTPPRLPSVTVSAASAAGDQMHCCVALILPHQPCNYRSGRGHNVGRTETGSPRASIRRDRPPGSGNSFRQQGLGPQSFGPLAHSVFIVSAHLGWFLVPDIRSGSTPSRTSSLRSRMRVARGSPGVVEPPLEGQIFIKDGI